jgi:hypothetical protein
MLQAALEVFPEFEYIAMADDDGLVTLRCCHARPHVDCAQVLREIMINKAAPMGDMRAQQLCLTDMERHLGVVRPQFAGLFRTWSGNALINAAVDQAIREGSTAFQRINWPMADGLFNVFSREAIELDGIIPYNEEVEKTSWWMSQAITCLRVLCKYGRSDSIMITATMAPRNDQHRDYPRGLPVDLPGYIEATRDLQDPVKCPMKMNAGRHL